MSTSIDFFLDDAKGEFSVQERGETQPSGAFDTVDLVEKNIDDMHFNIISSDGDVVCFATSAFHVENDETKRAFHSHLKIKLDRDRLRRIHAFLSFLLEGRSDT